MIVRIIGFGFLGRAMYELLKLHPHLQSQGSIEISDPEQGRHAWPADYHTLDIVCVPTPSGPNGECDTSIVRQIVGESRADIILLKSTVAPGTTAALATETGKRIVFSPEYMGESLYYVPEKYLDPKDMRKHGFMIIGGGEQDRAEVIDFFLPLLGPTCRFREMTSAQAEIVKYAENSFFAMKVAFANELRRICDAFGVGYHAVREGWLDDPRVGPMHTAAFKQSPGFGGKCLPKDIAALYRAALEVGYDSPLLAGVIKANEEHRK